MSQLPPLPEPKNRSSTRDRLAAVAPLLLGGLLLGFSGWAIYQEGQKYGLHTILQSLAGMSWQQMGWALGLTGLNYLTLTGYDTLAVRFVKQPLPYWQTALVAAVSYGISNTVGLALVSSSAIRYRFYASWGFSAGKIAQIIAFCNLSFWVGLLAVGGVVFLIEPLDIPEGLHLPFHSVFPIGVLCLALVFVYLLWNLVGSRSLKFRRWTLPHLSFQLSVAQVVVTSLTWMVGAAVLYVLLPSSTPVSASGFFGVYLLAQVASIFSNVPGGLGVFEMTLLLLLPSGSNSADLLGTLLAYRGIHYLLPLAAASGLLGAYELRQRWGDRV